MTTETKDSGVKWIGTVPADWEINKIKYIASLKGRIGWQGLTSEEYTDEGAYLITGVDFENGGINWDTCVHVPMRRWEEARDIQIENGDLLITKDGTIGKVAIVSGCTAPTSLNSGVLRISTIDGYDRKFLYWVLQSDVFWAWFVDKNAGNSTIQHLYQGDFAEFKYAIPPIDEQRAIAAFLDTECAKIDNVIDDLGRQIKLLQKYRKSVITKVVTKGIDESIELKESRIQWVGMVPDDWTMLKMKHYSYMKGRIGWQGLTADEFIEEGPYLVTGTDFENGRVCWDRSYHISEKRYNEAVPIQLKVGDLLVTKDGTIGKLAYIDNLPGKASLNSHLLVIRPVGGKYTNRFLYWVLSSSVFQGYYELVSYGSTMDSLSQEKIGEFVFYAPAVDEQEAIADYLDEECRKIDGVIDTLKRQLELMLERRRALIYEYVTGKKRVKEVLSHAD